MTRIDKNKVQQLTKELSGLIIPNHQYKKWELKENLTKEQLINLERLLVKENIKHNWSKELEKALSTLHPGLHPCCLLRGTKERLEKINLINLKSSVDCPKQIELLNNLVQELANQEKSREEKAEAIINFCSEYLNHGVKEDWRKKRHKALMLLTLAKNEWKGAKKEIFKEVINEKVIEKMRF